MTELESWLASDDPVKRRAAEHKSSRLAGKEPPPNPTPPPPRKTRLLDRSQKNYVNTCLYRECRTGCQRSLCHAGKGDYWHQVWEWECLDCLNSITKGVADAGSTGSGS